jgi:hypothetical protein
MAMSDLVKKIRAVDRGAKALDKMTPTDEELADAIGDVRVVERRLQRIRRGWESLTEEMDTVPEHDKTKRVDEKDRAGRPVAVGERWEVVPTFTNKRSFNTQRIINDLSEGIEEMTGQGITTGRLLILLKERDALRFTWQWTNLKSMFHAMGVKLVIGPEEIDPDASDLDDPHVGEWRVQSGVKRVPLKEE